MINNNLFVRLWKNKFKWQVWFRVLVAAICLPFILISIAGKYSDKITDHIKNNLPDFKENE